MFVGRKSIGLGDRLEWGIEEEEESQIYIWANQVAGGSIYWGGEFGREIRGKI